MLTLTAEHERSPDLTGWHTRLKPDMDSNPSFVLLLLLKSQAELSKVPPPSSFTACTSFHDFFLQCWDGIWVLAIAKRLAAVCIVQVFSKRLLTRGERSHGWGVGLDVLQRSLLNHSVLLWWEGILPINFAVVGTLGAFDEAFSPGVEPQVCPTCSVLKQDEQRDANCQNHNG